MKYKRMSIEVESPEELGYSSIKYNLAESSIADKTLRYYGIHSFDELLAYIPHRGNETLRNEIIADNSDLAIEDVLVTAGAAMALFIVATSMLSREDHLIVIRPNYASNIETPKAIGCEITYIDLDIENGWQLPIDLMIKAIKPNTKLISLTCPHNPTGIVFNYEDLQKIINHTASKGIYVLIDETYRELNFQSPLRPYFASISQYVISVGSMSKAYGVPGIRIGWLISKDKKWMETFLAAKEQILLSNPVIDEGIATTILCHRKKYQPALHQAINDNYNVMESWLAKNTSIFDFVLPNAGVVCFPKIKANIKFDFDVFQTKLYSQYATLVGYGHWFDMDDSYMRLGFGYPTSSELTLGLENLLLAVRESCY